MIKNNKIILWAIIVVLAVVTFIYVKNSFSFGFAPLFCFLLLFLLLPLTFKEKQTKVVIDRRTQKKQTVYCRDQKGRPIMTKRNSFYAGLLIFLFGGLALYALGNYFNPKEEVYSNYQHHALRFDGVKVENLPFHLAGDNDDSFIDSPEISGQVDIIAFDSLGVKLRTRGLLNPLYQKGTAKKHKNLNKRLIHFDKGEVIELVGTEVDGSGNPLKCRFVLNEVHENGFPHPIDSTQCVFIGDDGQRDTASFNRFLISGYPLTGIAADIPVKMDLSGIKIVRDSIDIDVKRREIKHTYADRGYLLELSPSAKLFSVRVGDGELHKFSKLSSAVDDIYVPLNKSLYIGLGNHSLNSFRFELSPDKKTLFLKYALPKYQYLSSSEDSRSVSVMVTTNIIENPHPNDGESGLIENLTDNLLLFDLFDRYGNKFNIEPFYLNYKIGPTNEKMLFTLSSNGRNDRVERDIPANKAFSSIKSKNGTEWLIQVENFRDTTPFKSSLIAKVMLAIILLSAVSMIFSMGSSLFTSLEYAFHLIIIAFLSVRFFLLWRVTTFPPINSISLYEFSHLRELRWFSTPLICLAIFYVAIAVTKFCINRHYKQPNNGYGTRRKPLSFKKLISRLPQKLQQHIIKYRIVYEAVIIAIAGVVIAIIGKVTYSPVVCVLGPIAAYLCFDLYIYKVYATSYLDDLCRSPRKESIGERANAIVLSIVNMIITSFVTLFLDGGFGVMFTMFMLFSFWLKLVDIFQYTKYGNESKRWPKLAFYALFLVLVLVVAFYKDIFIRLLECVRGDGNIWLFFIVIWLAVCLIAVCTLIILDIRWDKRNVRLISIAAGASLILCLSAGLLSPRKLSGSHMEYRTRVHMESAGDILKSVDSPESQNKFLQASLNDWILYEYQEIGDGVKLFGENGNGYFKLQPQSKLGAMWFAQTTDICLSRFIIAEHGTGLAWLFVVSFVLALLLALLSPLNSRWPRIVSSQIVLLLAVQTLMILLANTRAFIFFGQDFPLISLTSRLSSMYFFFLATLAVCSALIGKYDYNYELYDDIENDTILRSKRRPVATNIMIFFFVSAFSLYFSRDNLNIAKDKDRTESENNEDGNNSGAYYQDRTYDVDAILTQMNEEIEAHINPVFADYQKVHGVPELKRNMSEYISKFFDANPELDSECSQHTQLMLQNFKSAYSKKNSRNNIIFLRYRRTYGSHFQRYDTLEFVVRNEYYKFELPGKVTRQWQGSVLEHPKSEYDDDVYISADRGHSYAYIPKQYSASGNPAQILKTDRNSTARVISSDAILKVGRDMDVVEIDPLDFVTQNNRELRDAPLSKRKYIARRLLVNGERKYVYPYGHKLFWSRGEAYRIQREKKKMRDYGKSDAYLTVDINLCNDIYDAIETVDRGKNIGDDRTVVVADGNGNIRAMVDHRLDRKYRLNPNDYKRIAEVSDSLYIFGERGRALETRYFGCFAKDYLRLGPGSSQKPILWTAVTSMYNTGWWPDLTMAGIGKNEDGKQDKYLETSFIKNENDYVFTKFAGKPIEKRDGFRSLAADEGNGNDVNLEFYIYKSSNYYNAIIAYLGAFPKSVYEQDGFLDNDYGSERDGMSLFMKRPSLKVPQARKDKTKELERYAEDYIGTFPTIYADSKRKPLVFNRFLDADIALDETALAPLGLETNFGLGTSGLKAGEPSRYNIRVREGRTSERQLNEYVVRSVAIGTNTIWLTSPCKMAEMYGRLISMDKSYKLHFDYSESEKEYEFFDLDDSWGNASATSTRYQEYMKARKHLILGMSKVFGSNGTAHGLGLSNLKVEGYTIRIDDGKKDNTDSKSLYVYGKTGTINGKWGNSVNKEAHLLATIITNKKVSVCTVEELKDMKFYVIYQADYQSKGWKLADKDVIMEVLKSDAFKKYMEL